MIVKCCHAVTLHAAAYCSRVYKDFKMSCKGAHNPMPSSISRELNAHNWEVKYAPTPDNIYWSVTMATDTAHTVTMTTVHNLNFAKF